MKKFFLPKEVSERFIEVATDAVRAKTLNLGLFFDKYVMWWEEDELKCKPEVQIALLNKIYRNFQEVKKLLKDPNIAGKKFREKMIEDVKLSLPINFFPIDEYELYKKRMEALLNTLKQMRYHIEYLPSKDSGLSLNWRLTINLGAASVYETSLLFHRNYSIPYIPGSAVKGVTRHWTIQKFFDATRCNNMEEIYCIEKILELSNSKDLELLFEEFQDKFKVKKEGKDIKPSDKLYNFFRQNYNNIKKVQQIFGTQNQKGEVIFFDALPVIENHQNRDFIVLDVMNVHYKPYYEKGELPGDWHSPTPIFFLAVEKGTKFRFCIVSKNQELAKKAMELLKEAVRKMGIGAKTSAGYGYFEV